MKLNSKAILSVLIFSSGLNAAKSFVPVVGKLPITVTALNSLSDVEDRVLGYISNGNVTGTGSDNLVGYVKNFITTNVQPGIQVFANNRLEIQDFINQSSALKADLSKVYNYVLQNQQQLKVDLNNIKTYLSNALTSGANIDDLKNLVSTLYNKIPANLLNTDNLSKLQTMAAKEAQVVSSVVNSFVNGVAIINALKQNLFTLLLVF
ncbi:hypothetical protein A3F66_01555 [candidate division TM6 bacterium RIFCSPHIGHO2_12_FULL_32_22]|nr:MAG: hypothetical protein A3F66_01555 [candidate division TM6 bacterium RIFCSPHIGHO2_12_FULL_32_22]